MRNLLQSASLSRIFRLTAARIALLYAAFSASWILLSGYLVIATVDDQDLVNEIEIAKGLVFVIVTSGLLFLLLRNWHGAVRNAETDKHQRTGIHHRTQKSPILFGALFLFVPFFGWLVTEIQRPQIERTAYANLQAIAELKAKQIENWLTERLGDSNTLMESDGFTTQVIRLSSGHQAALTYVRGRLQGLRDAYGYQAIALLTPDGHSLLTLEDEPGSIQPNPALMRRAIETGETQFNSGENSASGKLNLDFIVPLFSSEKNPGEGVALVVLQMSPDRFLFPYIQRWPGISATGEAALVKPGGKSVVFLSPLKFRPTNKEGIRQDLSDMSLPAAVAIRRAAPGVVAGVDYRGVPVLVAHRPVTGTDWQILVKQDRAEVFASLKPLVLWISLVEFFAILAIAAALILLRRKHLQIIRMELQAESDRLLKHFYDLPFLGMAVCSPEEKRLLQFNDRLCEILGYSREELTNKDWTQISHRDDLDQEFDTYNKVMRGETDEYQMEKRFIRKDGSTVYTAIDAKCLRREDGSVAYFAVTLQDITEQKLISQRLRESEQNFRTLADSAPALIWTSGPDKLCTYFNQTWLGFTGRPLEKELGNGWTDGVHPDDLSRCVDIYAAAFERRESFHMNYRLLRHDGEYRWIQDNGSPRYNDRGEFIGYIGYCLDITEQILAQKLLQDSEARLGSMVRDLPMVLCTIDKNGIFTTSEGKALEKLGLKPGEVVGHSAYELYRDYPPVLDGIRSAIGGEAVHREVQIDKLWYDCVFQPFTPPGQYAGAMVASIDITARKAAEAEQSSHMKRLECLNRIADFHARSTQDLLDYALREALQFNGSSIGYVFLYDEARQEFTLNSWSREAMAECSVTHPQTIYALEKTGFWGEVVRQRKPIINNDFQSPHLLKKGTPAGHVSMSRFISIPIWAGEHIVAVLGMANKASNYDQTDIDQLTMLMDAVWRLVEQRQAEDSLQRISGLLQVAQGMAHVGGWEMRTRDGSQQWTDEIYRVLELEPKGASPSAELAASFCTPESRPIIEAAMREALEEGKSFDIEIDILTAKDKLRHIRTKGEACWEDGKIIRVIGAIQDITAYKTIQRELLQHQEHLEELVSQRTLALEQARDTAERATKAKSAFLATMSHEIRTPITAVLGMAHLATRTELTAKQQDYLDKIMISANMLLGVINDILDFSKIEAGRLELIRSEFMLSDVLDKVIAITGMRAVEKQLEFLVRVAANTPTSLIGDASRLAQILINLFSNAIKFTDAGEVMLSVSRAALQQVGVVEILFSVRDTGIGITPEQKTHLFQPFSQADTSDTRRFGGTGLGLAICKQLVDLMGGRIWVESTPEHGSDFSFTLPFGMGSIQADKSTALFPDLQNLHALVVDRNATSREILCGLLRGFGLHVSTAASVAAAEHDTNGLKGGAPDLLLIDWKEPKEDVLALIDATRQKKPGARFILLTVGSDMLREKPVSLVKADAEAHKPLTSSSLFDAITTALGRPKASPETAAKRFAAHEQLARLLGARVLLVEDNAFNQQIAQELLEGAGLEVVVADNGESAINLASHNHFDAVLMDIQMPVMGGLEATRRLRELPEFQDLPIIAMTAHAMLDEQHQCVEAGMNDFMSKPIEPEQLFKKLAFWISKAPLTSPTARPAPLRESSTDTSFLPQDLRGISIDVGLHYCNDKTDFYLRMLREFLKTKADTSEELRAALAEGDMDSARRISHTMKSVAGSIGALDLSKISADIEFAIRNNQETSIPMLLDRFETALNTVMTGLYAAFPLDRQVPPPVIKGPEVAALLRISAEISANLETDVGEALALLPALRTAAGTGTMLRLCSTLAENLDRFDIDAAKAALKGLTEVLHAMGDAP